MEINLSTIIVTGIVIILIVIAIIATYIRRKNSKGCCNCGHCSSNSHCNKNNNK